MIKNIEAWPSQTNIDKARNYIIEKRAFGFSDGGCRIFAEALKFVIPDCEIVTILRNKRPDHYGVYLPNQSLWGDENGLHENQYLWAQRFAYLENVSGNLVIAKEYIDSENIPKDEALSEKIAKMLIE
jgi:hypothetical protein